MKAKYINMCHMINMNCVVILTPPNPFTSQQQSIIFCHSIMTVHHLGLNISSRSEQVKLSCTRISTKTIPKNKKPGTRICFINQGTNQGQGK